MFSVISKCIEAGHGILIRSRQDGSNPNSRRSRLLSTTSAIAASARWMVAVAVGWRTRRRWCAGDPGAHHVVAGEGPHDIFLDYHLRNRPVDARYQSA